MKKINKNNLGQLEVAWEYKINGEKNYDIQSNVIVAEDKIFIPSYTENNCFRCRTGKQSGNSC